MPEETNRTIRIPVAQRVAGHRIRTIVVSRDQGIKALYDLDAKKIITYIFDKNKGWTMAKAKEWVRNHKTIKECKEVHVDQETDFIRLSVIYEDDTSESFEPSYGGQFYLTKEMIEEEDQMLGEKQNEKETVFCPNCGYNGKGKAGDECPECGSKMKTKPPKDQKTKAEETSNTQDGQEPNKESKEGGEDLEQDKGFSQSLEIVKADKAKQIVYGVFLWADKADHDGDIISAEDVEKVAHKFLVEYRAIDEMHKKTEINADIIESFIAWKDNLEFYGKMLEQGAWAGAIHVKDKKVWDKIEKGEYKGFSVRIKGRREPIGDSSLE
jgi:hypothetical protein